MWEENNCCRLTHRHCVNLYIDILEFIQVQPDGYKLFALLTLTYVEEK